MAKEKIDNIEDERLFDLDFGNIEIPDVDLSEIIDLQKESDEEYQKVHQTRYIKPRLVRVPSEYVMYENAEKLARDLVVTEGMRADCIVSGDFIFGDFIEAFLTHNVCRAERMIITTLSMNENNIDSLHNLIQAGYIGQLDIIISVYFYGHEHHNLIPYMYQQLDIRDSFQLAVADIHTKTCQFVSQGGKRIVMHGSANLRSSGNIEQFCIEENPGLYAFYEDAFGKIIEYGKTINKPMRRLAVWDTMTRKSFND